MADLITLPRAVVQQALAFTMRNFATVRDFEAARAVLHDTLKAALEQPEQADGMPASADERYLRRLLAARAGIPGAYYDDGEAHGAQHGISIDFMREPVADIDAKLRALNAARAKVTQPERLEWEFFGCMKIRPDMGADIFFARSLTLEPGVEFALCMAKPKGADA